MVEDGDGDSDSVLFPVVFFNGENDIHMGPVKVNPSMQYKTFQHLLSQLIGISPNQISIYLVDRMKSKSSPESRRRIPITGKANFSVISREKDCSFLAVQKRTRKNRRSKTKQDGFEFSNNFFLLRSNFPQDFYPNPMILNPNPNPASDLKNIDLQYLPKIEGRFSALTPIITSCEECRKKKFWPTDFHCCVNDAVIFHFRSPLSPISRPVKSSD